MTIGAVGDIGVTDARQLLSSLMVPDPLPFALLRRAGTPDGAVELMTGEVIRPSLLADLPLPAPGNAAAPGAEVLAIVPFRQITERGYACHDDGEPILALVAGERATLHVAAALDLLPDVEVAVSGCGFDLGDDEYEKVVQQIIDDEIRTGEGSNFVIKRSFVATLAQYRPEVAMSIFRRLLIAEPNAYWTFLVHAGDRTFVGASPEQHVRVAAGKVRMNPISGTYRYPPSGARLDDLLAFLADQKEIDELYMVVDEELKMLAGVCDTGARVYGPYLREMARLAHTEYVLEGASGMDVRDVLRETMFAPTVIGSPLQNACRVIVRHEATGRGYYGGALALFGRDPAGLPTMDSAIAIRTAEVRRGGTLRIDVGATLVRDSRPAEEVAETWAKAGALLGTLGVGRATTGDRAGGRRAGAGSPGSFATNREVLAALARRNAGLSSFWLSAPAPPVPPAGRALIVDAEDRFVGMLGHQMRALGHEVTIWPLARVVPSDVDAFDLVVLGPGPGDPRAGDDARICKLRDLVERVLARRVPFIAECLSHQVLSAVLGLRLVKRDRPNQGTQRRIDLFGASELVGFYNSYVARHGADRVPAAAVHGPVELCRDPDTGEVHALRGDHFASVQFHLESVLTQRGAEIFAELVSWTVRRAGQAAPVGTAPVEDGGTSAEDEAALVVSGVALAGGEGPDSRSSMPVGVGPGWRLAGAVAAQQPEWESHPDHEACCAALASSPALVSVHELAEVRRGLAVVAGAGAQVLQVGYCAESFYEVGEEHVRPQLSLLHELADELTRASGYQVLRVGRLAGQFAKPRSQPVERVGDRVLPVFRGHMVNSERPTPQAREHDPRRMVQAYSASAEVMEVVRADRVCRADGSFPSGPWTSHDALIMDYEANLLRTESGIRYLGSTHLPWIGDRTRQPSSAHVELLSTVANPVSCKIGPSTTPEDLRAVCARLDPERVPGRLTLIVRLGAAAIAELLPSMVATVRAQGHPAIWLSDPMHGNTLTVRGVKTRRLADVVAEAVQFRRILQCLGVHPGGLHLEVAAATVTECLDATMPGPERLTDRYTTLCDPRLNPAQAAELLRHWLT